jgi:hypothetical protein
MKYKLLSFNTVKVNGIKLDKPYTNIFYKIISKFLHNKSIIGYKLDLQIQILEPHSIKQSDYIVNCGVLYLVSKVYLDTITLRQSSEIAFKPRFRGEIHHLSLNKSIN